MRKQVAFESKGFEISEIVESNFNLGADDLIMVKSYRVSKDSSDAEGRGFKLSPN